MRWPELEEYALDNMSDGVAWLFQELTEALSTDQLNECAEHIARMWDLDESED